MNASDYYGASGEGRGDIRGEGAPPRT